MHESMREGDTQQSHRVIFYDQYIALTGAQRRDMRYTQKMNWGCPKRGETLPNALLTAIAVISL